jgi:DNA-binding transcriptional LysR family regulator
VLPEKLDTNEEILLENKLYLISNTKKVIKSRPLIYREQGSATRNSMSIYFCKSTKRNSIELTSIENVKQAVVAGLGYSIIPLIGMRNELQNKEVFIISSKGLPIMTYWRLI